MTTADKEPNTTTKNAKSPLPAADLKAFGAFIAEFKNESDRAAVILGAAKLDVMLYQLLQNTLRPNTAKNDELLDGDSPLATFSARIGLCHRLGLIDDNFCRALHMIRKIRNSFAHEIGGISLESGAHRDRIRELIGPLRGNKAFDTLTEGSFGEHPGTAGQFRSAVALAAIRLEGACRNALQIEGSPYSLLPKNFKQSATDSDAAP